MADVVIGKGKLAGKGTYAGRDFQKGEKVMSWELQELNQAEFDALPDTDKIFVHSFWGKMYRFLEPACYTNHSGNANTITDFEAMCDYAVRNIKKGEMITINATTEFKYEVRTFLEAQEGVTIDDFKWLQGGYRNAVVSYKSSDGQQKTLTLKRINGNWQILGNE